MAKKEPTARKRDPVSVSDSGSEPIPKRAKGECGKEASGLVAEIQNLNEILETFDTSSLVQIVQANRDDVQLSKQFGERLVQVLQKTKALSAVLRESTRRQRSTLSIRDVAVPQGTVDFEAARIWRQQVQETNNILLASLAELMGEREEAEMGHLNVMVDAFAEELDLIRQSEDLGPNKLELLIDSLKTGSSSS